MTFLSVPILTFLIFFPVVASLLILPFYKKPGTEGVVKWTALGITVIEFLVSLSLLIGNNPHLYQMQFVENHLWIPFGNIHYALGIDGISLVLVLMTTFLMPMTILTSWVGISKNLPLFMINLLVLEGAMIGVFCATDFVLFYVFWEAMLIPMYLIIGVWGGGRTEFMPPSSSFSTPLLDHCSFLSPSLPFTLSGGTPSTLLAFQDNTMA